MLLTDQQQDALTELINIACSRTAASLSELTGQRVLLDPPLVAVRPSPQLSGILNGFVTGDVATIHQTFTGALNGDALLLLEHQGAVLLADLLTAGHAVSQQLDESGREVLMEVGNILLNTCLSMFGDVLQLHVAFSVPRLQLEAMHELVSSLVSSKEELRYALVVYTAFHLSQSTVGGYIVIVLGVSSLDRLLQALDALA
jgi:chemotaxis protein CheC